MNKEEVLIITFKSIQDVLDLESKTKNGKVETFFRRTKRFV